MKKGTKKCLCILVVIGFCLTLAACGQSDIATYNEAVEKTDSITKGQSYFNLVMDNTLNTEGLSEEEIQVFNNLKQLEYESYMKYDWSQDLMESRNYMNFGASGIDSEIYMFDDNVVLKIPILGKYIDVRQLGTSYGAGTVAQSPEMDAFNEKFYNNVIQPVSDKWTQLIMTEEVVKGSNTILETEDGKVKAYEFTVEPDNEALKEFLIFSLTAFINETSDPSENPYLVFDDAVQQEGIDMEKPSQEELDAFIGDVSAFIEKSDIEAFGGVTYIDFDGYIIKQTFRGVVHFDSTDEAIVETIEFNIEMRNWEIEKEQAFEFPVLTDENTFKPEDLETYFNEMGER